MQRFPFISLPDKIGHGAFGVLRMVEACSLAGFDAVQHPCHVAAQLLHHGAAFGVLLAAEGLLLKNHVDCGCILYDAAEQTVKSGGSGPGCCASVLCGHILPRLEKGTQKRVLFIATGALMSQTTFLQKESIPAIAHLVELRSPQQKEENG